MLTKKEKKAAIQSYDVAWGLIQDEVTDEETGIINDGFNDFFKSVLASEFQVTEEELKLDRIQKAELKRAINTQLKAVKSQLNRLIDEL